ncbi:hypothetical protein SARC_08155 [Sphaeroforma arctica JP610]|uniref:Ribosome biogenesis protein NOP53 n=1 Tax=Sphaeroforma arctica JP610 TaxID=667725 RepID=A0A0L0FU51_9EUKA|nr:hypothetical protein SARC_08155 [Sphaeroforma arctica JP610]KNC79458.1 hypothetical protein SARC_08155 [Sphaeroforma arctica JP610]|eukprot:XP_014153360.1 hypothetical protein SARC_08155 [Sphaeroforma arctica JP610]
MPAAMVEHTEVAPTDHLGNPLAGVSKTGKKKQYSNNKKNWRKFVDVSDVLHGQDEKLKDELMGGAVDGKSNESLFVIDKKPSVALMSMVADRKKRNREKTLRNHAALEPHAHTKPVFAKKQKTVQNAKKNAMASDNVVVPPTSSLIKSNGITQKKVKSVVTSRQGDLWEAQGEDTEIVNHLGELVPKAKVILTKPKTMESDLIKGAVAVELAHPGQSYNPTVNDHQRALDSAAELIIRENDKNNFYKKKAGASATKIMSYSTYLEEMKIVPVESDDDLGAQSETDYTIPAHKNKALLGVRKTTAKKNKEKLLAGEARARAIGKAEKMTKNELNRLKTLKKEVAEDELAKAAAAVKAQEAREILETKPKKLGKHMFVQTPLDVQLPEELSGSLRTMKTGSNLMSDRFKSMQSRNMMEVRKKITYKRRYKKKEFEKRSFKSDMN